nr:hypothetical protein [Streptomyces asiaticus]
MDASSRASTAGCRKSAASTAGATRNVVVAAAAMAIAVIGP